LPDRNRLNIHSACFGRTTDPSIRYMTMVSKIVCDRGFSIFFYSATIAMSLMYGLDSAFINF